MINKFFVDNHLLITFDNSRIFVMDLDIRVKDEPNGDKVENLIYTERELELRHVVIKKLIYCKTKIGIYLCNAIGEMKDGANVTPEEIYFEVMNELSKFM